MWNRTIQAQSQLLDIYYSMMHEVNESITAGVHNAEKLQRNQLDLVQQAFERNGQLAERIWNQKNLSEVLVAQSQLAADQVAEGMELWRNYLRALQDSQLATLSSTRARVEEVTDEVRKASEDTARKAQDISKGTDFTKPRDTGKGSPKTTSSTSLWTGVERRKAANQAYSGMERRKAA